MHFLADSAVSQQWLSIAQHEKMFTTINPTSFIMQLCYLLAAPEKFRSTLTLKWGRPMSLCKKFCKILNRLGGVRIEAQFIDEKAPLEPLQLASCSRLKRNKL